MLHDESGILREFDFQQVREFYDPHPLTYGGQFCSPPLEIAIVVGALNGRSMSVYEAEGRLATALKEGNRLRVDTDENYIELQVTYKGLPYDSGHTFKLIKFR